MKRLSTSAGKPSPDALTTADERCERRFEYQQVSAHQMGGAIENGACGGRGGHTGAAWKSGSFGSARAGHSCSMDSKSRFALAAARHQYPGSLKMKEASALDWEQRFSSDLLRRMERSLLHSC